MVAKPHSVNTARSKLIAAALSATITVVVTASIVFGMAGLPSQGTAQLMAMAPARTSAQG